MIALQVSEAPFFSRCAVAIRTSLVALSFLVLGACASHTQDPTAQLQLPSTPSSAERDEYLVGHDDLLEVSVFNAPDLKREVRVNARGFIAFPLIGAVKVDGMTPMEIEALLAQKLGERYLQNPQVAVFVKEFTSQRVIVQGYVKKPGSYPIKGVISLVHAIALGEGMAPTADFSNVQVIRNGKGTARYDVGAIMDGKAEDPEIRGNDIVVVDRSYAKEFLTYIQGLFRVGASLPLF